MHIIGTSGHVDHGKTALIEALTGIDADRLPEEKERGMTIDLGFAHFEGPDGQPIGVIDVPGHERFIRNMVAGAWSLSCAVLVVAGNEAWMQQTEDHAQVLKAMGIRQIVCAITKTDLIEEDMLEYVQEIVQENLQRIFGKAIPLIPVSAITGQGIEQLRSLLLDLLKKTPAIKSDGSPYIHIDRAFTIKGSGTVITGSLSGGTLSAGDELTILPQGLHSRIRGIQSYYSSLETAYPVSRVACNLHGVKKKDISRGCIAALHPIDFWTEREFIVQWEQLNDNRRVIKNHMELEVASGTGHYIGKIHFLKTPGFARIVLNEAAATSWLAPCLFIQQGGHRILGKGHFIWPGNTDRHFRTRLGSVLETYPVPAKVTSQAVLRFLLNDWISISLAADRQAVETFISAEQRPARFIGDSVILEARFQSELQHLLSLASRPGGVNRAEFMHSAPLPEEVKEYLIKEVLVSNGIVQKDQLLISPEQLENETPISPLGRRLLAMLEEQRVKGLQLKDIREPGAKKELGNLARTGKVVALEGDIYYSSENFQALANQILAGLKPGAVFSIPEAKEKTGLSRRYMIPLLVKMEEKGMVKRDGDNRVVC